MACTITYPIGVHGHPWGEAERNQWRAQQSCQRRYDLDVTPRIEKIADSFDKVLYGQLTYEDEIYELYALRSRNWNCALPAALVTGGVHGYETSGIMGALEFLEKRAAAYSGRINLLVAPCVNPWGYERINRWNYDAIDPNRSFRAEGRAREATTLMELVTPLLGQFLMHIDLHETTDSDESEFRPALAARDGKPYEPDLVPDGFYLVTDTMNQQLGFQRAIIGAVEQVTHVALPDEAGEIIGCPVIANGVIAYPLTKYGMCASITGARYTTTTEVYPDSPRATQQQCNNAQVVAVCAALDFALAALPA